MTKNTRTTPRTARGLLLCVLAAVPVAGLAACSTAAEPAAQVALASVDGVPDRFLVSLRPGTPGPEVREVAQRLADRYGGRLGWVYQHATKGFAVDLPEREARRLAREPGVTAVEQDGFGRFDAVQEEAPHHLDRIDQRTRELDGRFTDPSGGKPTIYVVDTGLNAGHAEFGGRARVAHIFAPPDPELPPGTPFGADCVGHGTHVAGIAGGATRGVARTADIVALKVSKGCTNPLTRAGDVAMAVDFIAGEAAPRSVVSMSIGFSPGVPGAGTLRTAIANATRAGIPFVVSAGNDASSACTQTPADVGEVFTVAATRAASDARLPNSNFGDCVDIFAPGEDVESASHLGATALVRKSGTSMSTPLVAGAAALLRARLSNRITPEELFATLAQEATAGVVTDSRTRSFRSKLLHVGGFYRSNGMAVPDTGVAAISRIAVTGQGDPQAPPAIRVRLRASHAAHGQLQIDLFSPQGTRTRLKDPSGAKGSALELETSVSSVGMPANGTWTLSVVDTVRGTAGALDFWSIQV